MKNGARKRIKLLQINLQEAVWACEAEKCTWPFGYEDHIFFPRTVGKIWSCYWDDQKPTVQRVKLEQTDHSSITEGTEESTLIESPDKYKSIVESTENATDIAIITDNELEIASNNTESTNVETVNDQATNDSNLNDTKSKVEDIVKDTNSELDTDPNSSDEKLETPTQTVNRRAVPKITKIEKTNISVINVKQDKSDELNSTTNDIKLLSRVSDSQNQKQVEKSIEDIQISSNTPKKSNLNVTTVQIDGLPPITLSYEIPEMISLPETVPSSTPKKAVLTSRRNVSSGRQYEKFSFSALKKKKECGNTETKPSSDSDQTNPNTSLTGKVGDNDRVNVKTTTAATTAIPTGTTTTATGINNVSNQDNKLTTDTSLLNSNDCIDNVLEGLLTNSYNASADINDEWLDSLLS